jgi:purine-binding chemotaxis protein CheW
MADEMIQLVSFDIEKLLFGLEILHIQEIIRFTEITQIPNSPPFVEGVVNLRGRVIPVIDLRKKMALPLKEYDQSSRIIISEVGNSTVGFIVDSVEEVMYVKEETLEIPPDIALSIDSEYIKNIVKLEGRLLIMLDIENVLTGSEKETLATGGRAGESGRTERIECPYIKEKPG